VNFLSSKTSQHLFRNFEILNNILWKLLFVTIWIIGFFFLKLFYEIFY